MTLQLEPFQLGEVVTGEPHLYVANPPAAPLDSTAETDQIPQAAPTNSLKRFAAAIRQLFRHGPTAEDALATALGKVFRP